MGASFSTTDGAAWTHYSYDPQSNATDWGRRKFVSNGLHVALIVFRYSELTYQPISDGEFESVLVGLQAEFSSVDLKSHNP